MTPATLKRLRWSASSALLSALGDGPYESLQVRWVARSIRSGRWRDPEIDVLPHLVADGETAIDVGANFGLYSFHLARLVGDAGQVIAVEAIPSTARVLRKTLAVLSVADRVQVLECGAGDEAGIARFAVPRRPDGSADTGIARVRPDSERGDESDVEVRIERLDALAGDSRPAFVKIDAEGAELHVLRGASALIEQSAPTLLLEVSPSTFARQGVARMELATVLGDWGYATYRFDADTRRLVPQPAADANGNVVAVHPSRAERIGGLLG